jgi:hypothetical protein
MSLNRISPLRTSYRELLAIRGKHQQQKGWAIDVLSGLARPREETIRIKSVVE